MGNGYPMGGVICSQKLANSLRGYYSTFGGNPVSCSIGRQGLEETVNTIIDKTSFKWTVNTIIDKPLFKRTVNTILDKL